MDAGCAGEPRRPGTYPFHSFASRLLPSDFQSCELTESRVACAQSGEGSLTVRTELEVGGSSWPLQELKSWNPQDGEAGMNGKEIMGTGLGLGEPVAGFQTLELTTASRGVDRHMSPPWPLLCTAVVREMTAAVGVSSTICVRDPTCTRLGLGVRWRRQGNRGTGTGNLNRNQQGSQSLGWRIAGLWMTRDGLSQSCSCLRMAARILTVGCLFTAPFCAWVLHFASFLHLPFSHILFPLLGKVFLHFRHLLTLQASA